jgi:hypothetical protein
MDVQFPHEANKYEAKDKGRATVIPYAPYSQIAAELNNEISRYIENYDPLITNIQLNQIRTVVLHC